MQLTIIQTHISSVVEDFAEKIDDLKLEIQTYGRFLANMIRSKRQDEAFYRIIHKTITKKVRDFENEMKEIKRRVFAIVRKRKIK